MPEPVKLGGVAIAEMLDAESLREWIQLQRWYASKSRSVTGVEIVESVALDEDPLLLLTLVQTRFATGTHELYQLPIVLRPVDADEQPGSHLIARIGEWDLYDALADPTQARSLLRR